MNDARRIIGRLAKTAAISWFEQQSRNQYAMLYLYYRPGAQEIAVAENCPEGYTLASPERISPVWDVHKAQAWAFAVLWQQPILKA